MHNKTKTNTELPQTMGSTLNSSRSRGGGGGGGSILLAPNLRLDSINVKTQNCLARMEAS